MDYSKLREVMEDMEELFPGVGRNMVIGLALQYSALEYSDLREDVDLLKEKFGVLR